MAEKLRVDLKWSLWMPDRDEWTGATDVWDTLAKLGPGESRVVLTAPKKEILFGRVTIRRDAAGSWLAEVSFRHEWDEVESLADTLRIPERSEAEFEDYVPHAEGHPGVSVTKEVGPCATFEELMAAIDLVEGELTVASDKCWEELKTWAEGERRG